MRDKILLPEIENLLLSQLITITLAGEHVIYKDAENTNCGVYSDTPLLPTTYKILYKIRMLSFIGHAKECTRECHCGFQRRRSADQVFCALYFVQSPTRSLLLTTQLTF